MLRGRHAYVLGDKPRVVGRLGPAHHQARQAGRLPGDGVLAHRIGQVWVEADPERDPRPGRAAVGGNSRRVDVILGRMAAEVLDRVGRVEHRRRKDRVLRVAVVDRSQADAQFPAQAEQVGVDLRLIPGVESATVDVDQQGGRLCRFRLPNIEYVPLVRAIAHVFHVRRRELRLWQFRLRNLGGPRLNHHRKRTPARSSHFSIHVSHFSPTYFLDLAVASESLSSMGAWINQQQRKVIEKRPDRARPDWFDEIRHRFYCPSLRTTNVASP